MSDGVGIAVGSQVPEFTGELVSPDGTTEQVSLSELTADKPVLFNFYTADFSPNCTRDWCSFRDFEWFASGENVTLVGVSKSGSALHRRFLDALEIPFPLFADRDLEIAETFGVAYQAFKLVSRARRSCFLVDTDRRVRYKWVGEHWLDPAVDRPPIEEIYDTVVAELDAGGESLGGL